MTDQSLKTGKSPIRRPKLKPRYLLLWERIQTLTEKLEAQEANNKMILRQFAITVRPLETLLANELIELTRELIKHFHIDEDDANRSLLGFWIIDNFQTLVEHPFANQTTVQDLYDEWRLPLLGADNMVEAQLSLLMAERDDMPGGRKQRANYPDADMFATSESTKQTTDQSSYTASNQNEKHTASPNVGKSSAKQHPKKSTTHAQTASVEPTPELADIFNIDKLFRRVAHAVHPDREHDETLKAEKHDLMSACLQARDEGDIALLLSLYAKHVGELPDSWSEDSTSELVAALESQITKLEQRNAYLHTQDPLLQLILDRYLGYDTSDVERRIAKHCDHLQQQIKKLKMRRQSIATSAGLEEALDERRDIEMDKLVLANLTNEST